MRRLYILDDEEFDEEFDSPKYDDSDGYIDNPTCPRCGRELLLAYTEGAEFEVITWYCLLGDEPAETWWLVCGNFNCDYEEQVELVKKPAGATLYDVDTASHDFGAETGFDELSPTGQLEMKAWLQYIHAAIPNRKLPSLIDTLQWQYDQHVEQLQEWLPTVPAGRKIEFTHGGNHLAGYLVSFNDKEMVVRDADSDNVGTFPLEQVAFFGPRYFRDEPEEKPADDDGARHFIMIASMERCVVRGHHLHLDSVDRFGRHHVRTWDEAVGLALGMKHLSGTCYEAIYRRDEVEGRYDLRRLVKVAGHWLEWMGRTDRDDITAVKTDDPAVARELGFRAERALWPNEDGTWPEPTRWYGFVADEQIEEREEHPVWYWPFPEAKGCDR